ELLAIAPKMVTPRQNQYGRADRAAAWALLARMYLNAEVYTGEPRYKDCVKYCEKIMSAGYALAPEYGNLFLADNHTGAAANEIIFAIPYDATYMQTYGGTTFIINASVGGEADPAELGIPGGGWGGLRCTKNLVYLFAPNGDLTAVTDERGQVYN